MFVRQLFDVQTMCILMISVFITQTNKLVFRKPNVWWNYFILLYIQYTHVTFTPVWWCNTQVKTTHHKRWFIIINKCDTKLSDISDTKQKTSGASRCSLQRRVISWQTEGDDLFDEPAGDAFIVGSENSAGHHVHRSSCEKTSVTPRSSFHWTRRRVVTFHVHQDAAGFCNNQRGGGHVPNMDTDLVIRFDTTSCHQTHVDRCRTCTADPGRQRTRVWVNSSNTAALQYSAVTVTTEPL